MSNELDDVARSLFIGQIPNIWRRLAPDTLKSLGNWMVYFLRRFSQYMLWVRGTLLPPLCLPIQVSTQTPSNHLPSPSFHVPAVTSVRVYWVLWKWSEILTSISVSSVFPFLFSFEDSEAYYAYPIILSKRISWHLFHISTQKASSFFFRVCHCTNVPYPFSSFCILKIW